jgi:hypothetical protein
MKSPRSNCARNDVDQLPVLMERRLQFAVSGAVGRLWGFDAAAALRSDSFPKIVVSWKLVVIAD